MTKYIVTVFDPRIYVEYDKIELTEREYEIWIKAWDYAYKNKDDEFVWDVRDYKVEVVEDD